MLHKYACLLAGVGVAVLLSQPSTAREQAVGRDLVIAVRLDPLVVSVSIT